MNKFSALILLSVLLLPSGAWSDDTDESPRTGYFRSSTTPLELLGERGAETLSEVFAPDEKLRWQLNVPENYDPANPPGLIVYVNRANWGGGKKVWSDVFRDRNLIWAGALDAGEVSPAAHTSPLSWRQPGRSCSRAACSWAARCSGKRKRHQRSISCDRIVLCS
jgi:hypothetical protein